MGNRELSENVIAHSEMMLFCVTEIMILTILLYPEIQSYMNIRNRNK